jgi:hypothetical protein
MATIGQASTDAAGQRPAGHREIDLHDVRPFAVRLDELRRINNLTFRALAARLQACARPGDRGMSHGHLFGLAAGGSHSTPQVVELVARAFALEPEAFIEWRLWQVQQLFDPERSDGFEAAVAQLVRVLRGRTRRRSANWIRAWRTGLAERCWRCAAARGRNPQADLRMTSTATGGLVATAADRRSGAVFIAMSRPGACAT